RAMATFKYTQGVGVYRDRLIGGMTRRGYDPELAERVFKQIEGFGSYGFPESHAISFALLVYASAWVKCKHPDVFLVSLLNAQPMGFYQPAQLVRDAREHKVEVRPPDILASDWNCTLEAGDDPRTPHRPVRLGLRQIKGFREDDAKAIMRARETGAATLEDFALRAGLTRRALELLAEADALRALGLDRRAALWAVKGLGGEIGVEANAPLLARQTWTEAQVELPFMSPPQHVAEDYRTTSLSLKAHPCSFFRESLARAGATPAAALKDMADRRRVAVSGLVLVRQRPGTAKGVVFMTLEDETGIANIVVWKDAFAANRRLVMGASFIIVHGQLQKQGEVIHLVAERFTDLSGKLGEMRDDEIGESGGAAPQVRNRVTGRLIRSRDFH
ncbi:MAG: dnaE, partial [Phenylobacterium sp.]|nr:dnaE [Phenylobacterium sp.]